MRQEIERTERLDLPTLLSSEIFDCARDNFEKGIEFIRIAIEVIGAQQPERHDRDIGLFTPIEKFNDLLGTFAMAIFWATKVVLRPTTISIEYDTDMVWGLGAI